MAELAQSPKGSRVHIGLFGRRNAGKSSVINRITKQTIALVSDVAGTTTDPVYKAMELLPIGPVMMIDTAGIDDEGALGELRIGKTLEVMRKTDIGVIVIDSANEFSEFEEKLLSEFRKLNVPTIVVLNKAENLPEEQKKAVSQALSGRIKEPVIAVSAAQNLGFDELRNRIVKLAPMAFEDRPLLRDLIKKDDTVLFCVPIDTAAPKGRLILPEVQAIRDVLDANAKALVVKENQLAATLKDLKEPPALVVTDSQVFKLADRDVPAEVPLTSFSILMARTKGDLESLVEGASHLKNLRPGDKILIAEACTHQCQAEDIGRVKIPRWLSDAVGGSLDITWYTGDSFPEDVSPYKLVVHCGACMINRRAMLSRQRKCREAQVPIVNYGVLIACIHGILGRALSPIPELHRKFAKTL